MIRTVDGCVGCGQKPCYFCTELELVCDACEEVVESLYWLDDEQLCEECWKETAFQDADEVKL